MPLLPPLLQLVKTRRFWTDFLAITSSNWSGDDGPFPELADARIDLPVSEGYALSVGLDKFLSYFPLHLHTPGAEEYCMGYDDCAHPIPNALRWTELERICEAVAARDPELVHPGLPLLFLSRFAPICLGEDIDHSVRLLYAAWKRLGLFTDTEIQRFMELKDRRDQYFQWHYDATRDYWWLGRAADAPETFFSVHTHRGEDSAPDEFPSAAWTKLLAEAERVAGTSGGDRTMELAAAPFELRLHHLLQVQIPLLDVARPLKSPGRYLTSSLNSILRSLELGTSQIAGGQTTRLADGTVVAVMDSLYVNVWGDLNRGTALIRQSLWWLRAAESTTLSTFFNFKEMDLRLATAEGEKDQTPAVYLGICKPEFTPISGGSGYVAHTIPDSSVDSLKSFLGGAILTDPAANGWLSVTADDGAGIDFNFSPIGEREVQDMGVVALQTVTRAAVDVLYRFMSETGMVLLPVAVTTKALDTDIASKWPKHTTVASASDLFDILAGGPYAWWKTLPESTSG